jgi:hypothetical protein
MTRTPLLLASTALALGASACAFDPAGAGGLGLEDRLQTRVFLDLAPTSQVGVCAYDADGRSLPYVEPAVAGGRAVLRTTGDGWLLVEDLDIELDDVTIPPGELGPGPIELTDVRLRLGTQLAVRPFWSGDGQAAWGTGEADVLLDWAWRLSEERVYPLATQRLGEAAFTVTVVADERGDLTAQVFTAVTGEVHRLQGLVTFEDLTIAVDAVTPTATVD